MMMRGEKANEVFGICGGLPLSGDYEAIYSGFVVPQKLGLTSTCPCKYKRRTSPTRLYGREYVIGPDVGLS
ncbi:hypothetical protein TorRG33x02_337820 [Trema orientale]|uniref:Uncharacterized protein n=1 Tax=Trema orientale TaxID=63057 RepID=A0A2P5AYF6_TREOI|nr:hypothetical protein TorRG33x02_337820 [Trema orientale]